MRVYRTLKRSKLVQIQGVLFKHGAISMQNVCAWGGAGCQRLAEILSRTQMLVYLIKLTFLP